MDPEKNVNCALANYKNGPWAIKWRQHEKKATHHLETGKSTSFVRKKGSVNGGLKRCNSHLPSGDNPFSAARRTSSSYFASASALPFTFPLNRNTAMSFSGTATRRTFGSVGKGASSIVLYFEGRTKRIRHPPVTTGVVMAMDSVTTGVVMAMVSVTTGVVIATPSRFEFSGVEKTPMYLARRTKLFSSSPSPPASTATAGGYRRNCQAP
mmetsp:Transcript_17699/g.47797  ORF Transcript_17699/g.47797 Transcript_17699/m.47797 type:complete len:210 (+) Transcript_17699:72-701(+)